MAPTDPGVRFRLAASDDASAMVAFHNSYYGTDRKVEHWLWEFATYAPAKSVFACAEHEGKIVATQAMIPIPVQVGSESVLSGKSESTLLLPDYRGSALMADLYEYAVDNCIERGMQFIWGFTGAVKAFRRFGFVHFPVVQTLVRPGNVWVEAGRRLRLRTPLWHRIGSAGKFAAKSAFVKRDRRIRCVDSELGYQVTRTGTCDEGQLRDLHDRLRQACNRQAMCIRYERRYLQWRLRQHPFIKYHEYRVSRDGTLRAYAFVALVEGVASISELTSEDAYATSLLLDTVVRDLSGEVGMFRFLGNPEDALARSAFGQLHEFGFSPYGTGDLVFRDLSGGGIKGLSDMRNWHISGLWTEGYSM